MSDQQPSETTENIETRVPWASAKVRTERQGKGLVKIDNFPFKTADREKPEPPPIIQTEHVRPISRAEQLAKVKAAEAMARARQATAEAAQIGRRLERMEIRANSLSHIISSKNIELSRLRNQLEELKPAALKAAYRAAFLKYKSYGGPAGSFQDPAAGNELLHAGNLLSNAAESRAVIEAEIKAAELELERSRIELAEINTEFDATESGEEAEQNA